MDRSEIKALELMYQKAVCDGADELIIRLEKLLIELYRGRAEKLCGQ